MSLAAPPLSGSTTTGRFFSSVAMTVRSVPGPPPTTSCTMAGGGGLMSLSETKMCSQMSFSRPARTFVSVLKLPTVPLSTSTKWVWLGSMGTRGPGPTL